MLGEGLQRALGHGVDREGRRERLYIKYVGGFGILGAGAGPKQALWSGAGTGCTQKTWRSQQLQVCLVSTLGYGDAEPIGQLGWSLSGSCNIPAADKERCDRGDGGIKASFDAPLDPAQIGFGRGDVLLPRE